MNRLVRVLLALVAILLGSTVPASALEDVRGWRNTRWGMTEPEVRRSVGALGLALRVTPADAGLAALAEIPFKTKVDIEGSEYPVAFYFLDEPRHLGRVQMGGLDTSREDALKQHGSLLRTLTDRYGAPSDTDSRGTHLSMTRWAFKTTTIALNMYTDTGTRGRATQVAVTYSPTVSREDDRDKILGLGLLRLLGGTWRR
jgi:hypothetical protein